MVERTSSVRMSGRCQGGERYLYTRGGELGPYATRAQGAVKVRGLVVT